MASAKKNGKRVPLREDAELLDWLRRKAETSSFTVDEASLKIVREGREWFGIEKRSQNGVHHSVDFSGILKINDRACFTEHYPKGIGSAKSFGFGLLMLAPLLSVGGS